MKKIFLISGIILFIVIFEQILSRTSFLGQLELITYDIRAKIAVDTGPFNRKFRHADKNIVIVSIDDYSRKEIAKSPELSAGLGSFPWKRSVWVDVLDFIEQGEPKIVLFDLIFNDLNENTWHDRRFAQTLRKYDNVVLATSLNDPKYLVDSFKKNDTILNSNYLPASKPLNVQIDDEKLDDAITYYSHAPVHNFYTEYNTIGVVNKTTGADSVIRTYQPVFKLIKNDEVYYLPSLAFAGFMKYVGEDGNIIIKNHKLFYKDRMIPVDEKGQTNISWHGSGNNYLYVPVSKILLNDDNTQYITPDFFKDKIVIIGRTEAGTDIHPSAVNPSYAGPEANATAIDNFINDSYMDSEHTRKFVTKIPAATEFLLTVLCCLAIIFMGLISKNALICFLNNISFIIVYILLCIWLFANPETRIWLPVVVPVYYLIMTGSIIFAYKFQQELLKRATVMNMFGKFVSPKVLASLLKNQNNLVLKSTRKRITVMFCDIKDFTTLSEKCNPEQLVNNLNELFNEIVGLIFENNGTVDKFIGDCIMAYWGDPIAGDDDAYMAVKTALEIKKRVNELKVENAKQNKIIFDVKIGINTGEALLGLSGSDKIMSYTAMGDAVNVASRLESNCSKLNRDILISKSTYDDAKSKIIVLESGKISVKGRDEQIEIYEPIGLAEENLSS